MGLSVCGLALLGLSIFTVAYKDLNDPWNYIAGFGFGASSIALFARVGGGVYTKAADVGADLVGKVESQLNEDDPRNSAVIADNVGDNVGDVAGMGADLFESYAGSIIAACTLTFQSMRSTSVAALVFEGHLEPSYYFAAMALPFWIAGAGIVASIIGIFCIRTGNDASTTKTEPSHVLDRTEAMKNRKEESLKSLERLLWISRRGIMIAALALVVFAAVICIILFAGAGKFWLRVWVCIILGLVAGEGIGNVENSHVHNSILQNTHTLENRYVDGILYFLQFFPDPVYREKVINRTSYCVDPRSWSRYDLMCDSRHYLGCDHCGLRRIGWYLWNFACSCGYALNLGCHSRHGCVRSGRTFFQSAFILTSLQ